MALDYRRVIRPGKKAGRIFLRSTSLVYKIFLTNLGACKPTFYTIYTTHLRWNSTMRYCFYHTDLGQDAVFHNFATQIALILYSGRSKHGWAFSETVKEISKITYGQPVSLLQIVWVKPLSIQAFWKFEILNSSNVAFKEFVYIRLLLWQIHF